MNRTGKYFDDFSFGIPHFLKKHGIRSIFTQKKEYLQLALRARGIMIPFLICRIDL